MSTNHDVIEPDQLDIDESEEYFGPLYPFVMDDEITDVDFNGTDLWLTNSKNVRYHSDTQIPLEFVEQFTKRVANAVSKPFHKQQPILEAETGRLRITIVHESVAISGRTICIRKSLPYVRMTEEGMLRDKYCTGEILNLLKSCIIAKQNIVFCGEPGAGKTECAKFFSQYIPANQRVITIEDNPEWHYKEVNPSKDCVELKVGRQMDYTAAIKTCLRLNPKWMMLSESRSTEILKLLEGFSTGVKGLTTLHADDVRNVPDRMVNMSGQARNEGRMENDIYSFIDLAVLIRRKEVTEEDGSTHVRRFIDQLCFFERDGQNNLCHMIVEDGIVLSRELPKGLLKKLQYAGLPDPMTQPFPTAQSLPAAQSFPAAQSLPAAQSFPAAQSLPAAQLQPIMQASPVKTANPPEPPTPMAQPQPIMQASPVKTANPPEPPTPMAQPVTIAQPLPMEPSVIQEQTFSATQSNTNLPPAFVTPTADPPPQMKAQQNRVLSMETLGQEEMREVIPPDMVDVNRRLTLVAEAPPEELASLIPPVKKGGTYLGWVTMPMCVPVGG